ncbi:Intrinsic membrane protein PufX [Loktanella fryxellensis]|uniref:Intrinsic membrane protein PufX n=1 Tax=Loktanella fryxellensis TaxID=245187 RepID=A0A1H7ZZ23_9RHOB|nr:RC-LH1 core complex protein PufX [Loktanella fryxellensis]SEM62964.1 Intrinsic membrane protein PufX [Loktanella fryxellensis]
MTDKINILGATEKARLTGDVTILMLKGAGYAAIVVLGIWLTIAVIAAIGRALPEESKQAPDPTPLSFLDTTFVGPIVSV